MTLLCPATPFGTVVSAGFRAQVHQAGGLGNSCRLVALEGVPGDNPGGRALFDVPMTFLAAH